MNKNDEELLRLREIHHQFKISIFMKDGSLVPLLTDKQTICNTHLKLAHEVVKYVSNPDAKRRMLLLIDKAYDMGKRMDKGLSAYRQELGIDKIEGRRREKIAADKIEDEADVTP